MEEEEQRQLEAALAEALVMEEDEVDDAPDVFEFHPMQLLCFENSAAFSFPCLCHGYDLIDPMMNATCLFFSDFVSTLSPALGTNVSLNGVYFVCGWACSMFYEMRPVFFNVTVQDRNGEGKTLMGVTIHVREGNRLPFIEAVAKMCEGGFIPCQYMRKMEWDIDEDVVYLFPDTWYQELVELLVMWQESETRRLYDAMD